jgi:cell fate (sporulation/competence/biofilm development) regulator YlbF (YheA/YmcA/DUF963 family)
MKKTATLETMKRSVHDFTLALAETPQYKAFERAAERFKMDQAAQKAKQVFEQKQQSLRLPLMLREASDEQRATLEALRNAFIHIPSVLEYSKAQSELEVLCRTVGDTLSDSIGLDYAAACGVSCCG